MQRRTVILLVGLAAIAGAGFYAWSEYERKPKGAAELKVDEVLSATDLLAAYVADEAAADARFASKVLEVSGTVEGSEVQGDKLNIFLSTGDPLQRIACEFDAASAPSLNAGDAARVRGICAGYNLDVLLQRCAIAP
ncbi:MAG: hypothetical protein JNM31_00565 [Flavobacteriales bacterium]|nr:hypothetical protein [Flavobacteriales bacterium]